MNDSKDEGGILPWPTDEAEPKPGELDAQQCVAARRAHEGFVSMANGPDAEKASKGAELFSFLPRLDAHRRNHTVLIDGTRGSGKTVVMLRLLQDWSDKLTRGENAPQTPLDKFRPEDGGLLVPVGLLDLEAVPRAANLATRIAGMFERVVGAMERRRTRDGRAPSAPAWALLEDDTLKSRQAWRHFVHAAALEWDPSIERRRAHIDPEAYVVEVEQAEHKGLQARECFREFIDALGADWQAWQASERRPFFIVPIDDADLNPARVVELFGLLRTLWHPRVGYLLTGDSGLFERVLTTHFRSQIDMPQLGGPDTWGDVRIQLVPDPERSAERLARDFYQKTVPVARRLRLEPLSPGARLSFVKDSLHRARMLDGNPEALIDYLNADGLSSLALPGRWRGLRDLRDRLERGEFARPFGAEHFALELWGHALRESSLSESHVLRLRESAYLDERRGGLGVASGSVVVVRPMIVFVEAAIDYRVTLAVGGRCKYEGEFREGPSLLRMNESVVAVWLLLTNLTRFGEASFRPSRQGSFELFLVETHCNMSIGEGNSNSGNWPNVTFRWPVPAWRQQREVQRLYQCWDERVRQSAGVVEDLALCFLWLVLEVSGQDVSGDRSWHALALRIVAISQAPDTELGDWALCHAGLLAAPESGLSRDVANQWIMLLMKAAEQYGAQRALRSSLLEGRLERADFALREAFISAKRAERVNGQSVVDLLAEIDKHFEDHPWKTLVEAPTS